MLRRRNSPQQILQLSPPCSGLSCPTGSYTNDSQKTLQSVTRTPYDSNTSDVANENESDDDGRPNISLNTTAMLEMSYIGYQSYSDGHIYPDQRCTVPKLVRDEFIRLAMVCCLHFLKIECKIKNMLNIKKQS